MTRTLVTGATGFVGSHVAERLSEQGHDLRCTVRATSDLRWLAGVDAETTPADLADAELDLARTLEGVERVVHAAGVTRAARGEVFRRVNASGTRRLAEAARRAGVRRFVFVSSLAARGPDDAEGPAGAYGRSKRRAEELLRRGAASGVEEAGRGRAMEVVVLRPGAVYGARDTELLPLFRLASRGWFPRVASAGEVQPVHVDDVATAAVRAVDADAPGFGPWPVAGPDRRTWPELADELEAALDRELRRVPVPGLLLRAVGAAAEAAARATGRPPAFDRRTARDFSGRSWTCDTTATEEALGWRPRVGLAEGLARTVRWYRRAGWL